MTTRTLPDLSSLSPSDAADLDLLMSPAIRWCINEAYNARLRAKKAGSERARAEAEGEQADMIRMERIARAFQGVARIIAEHEFHRGNSHYELVEALSVTLSLAKLKFGNLDKDVNLLFEKAERALSKARGKSSSSHREGVRK